MFRSSCWFKAAETKDRIYALVNLCGLANHPKFRTDYKPSDTEPFTEVDLFTEAARHLLSSGPESCRLDLLATLGLPMTMVQVTDVIFRPGSRIGALMIVLPCH